MESKQKYSIGYWYEWGGFCFWRRDERTRERFGYAIEARDLPLKPATIQRVEEMYRWHNQSLNWDYPPDPGPWREEECERFNTVARGLLETVREELGDEFEVIDERVEIHEDPDLDEYLKDPRGFRRESKGKHGLV